MPKETPEKQKEPWFKLGSLEAGRGTQSAYINPFSLVSDQLPMGVGGRLPKQSGQQAQPGAGASSNEKVFVLNPSTGALELE